MVGVCVISFECREIYFFPSAVKFDQVVVCIWWTLAFCRLCGVTNIGISAKERQDKKSICWRKGACFVWPFHAYFSELSFDFRGKEVYLVTERYYKVKLTTVSIILPRIFYIGRSKWNILGMRRLSYLELPKAFIKVLSASHLFRSLKDTFIMCLLYSNCLSANALATVFAKIYHREKTVISPQKRESLLKALYLIQAVLKSSLKTNSLTLTLSREWVGSV